MSVKRYRQTFHGKPQVKQRPRFYAGHMSTPLATQKAEAKIKEEYHKKHGNTILFPSEPLSMTVYYYCGDHRKRDLDNLVKLTCDGLNGTCYSDDSQIMKIKATKVYAPDNPRTLVNIQVIEEGETNC